jgi:hypothetical protein
MFHTPKPEPQIEVNDLLYNNRENVLFIVVNADEWTVEISPVNVDYYSNQIKDTESLIYWIKTGSLTLVKHDRK